jgi:putative sigma-54 modulation protein
MLKSHRPKKQKDIRHLPYSIFDADIPEIPEESNEDLEPVIVHEEKYKVKHLYRDEAIMDMEMNEKPFILFHDAKNDCLAILCKRLDGDYAMVARLRVSPQC